MAELAAQGTGEAWVWLWDLIGCNRLGVGRKCSWGPGPQGVILSYLVLEFLEPLEGRPTALVAPEGTSLLWSWGKVGAVWIFGIYEQCFQIHYL